MIKTVLLIFTLCIAISAAEPKGYPTEVLGIGEYISAKARYKSGDYRGAYHLFKTLFPKYSDDVNLNYYLAMSAVKLRKFDEATAAFERVLIKEPEFHRARLEFGRVLYLVGFEEEAKREFERVLRADVPQPIKENIRSYLDAIGEKKGLSSWYASLLLGFETSDNVNHGLDENVYNLPGLNISVNGESPKSDSAHVERLGLHRSKRIESYNNLRLEHRLILYNKSLSKHGENDLKYLSFSPSLRFEDRRNKMRYHVGAGIDYVVPGDLSRDRFTVISLTPGYTKLLSRHDNVTSYLKLQRILYDKGVSHERDYDRFEIGVGLRYENFSYLLRVARDTPRRGERSDIEKSIFSNACSYRFMLQEEMPLDLGYTLTLNRYHDEDILFASKRGDEYHRMGVSLSKIFDRANSINLSYAYTKNDSNQAAYEYDSHVASFNYIRKFQW